MARAVGWRQPILVVRAVTVQDGRVLLAYHRHGSRPGFWCFPGGHVEAGEGLVEALVREVREETGYEVEVCRVVYLQDFARAPGPDAAEVFFEARVVGGHREGRPEPGLVTVEWVALDELRGRPVLPAPLAEALRTGAWTAWQVPVPAPQAKGQEAASRPQRPSPQP